MGKNKRDKKELFVIESKKGALEKRIRELTSLYQVSKDIDEIADLDELFRDVAAIARNALNRPDSVFIIWVFDERNKKKIKAFRGLSNSKEAQKYIRKREIFSIPLNVGGKRRGGFAAGYKGTRNAVSREEKQFVREIAELIGREVERRKIKQDLNRMFIEVVKTLSAALDARDHYTVDHSKRISESCRLISKKLNLSGREKENIAMAALLHDIGKIGISDGILAKPSGLTPEEFDKVKQHPLISEKILEPIEALKGTLRIIRHHHERYDGKGYPDGLRGRKIPAGARILAVCDSYDAMISERPYRGAMSIKKALAELSKHSGTQFDPQVAKTMISLIKKGLFR